MASDVEDIFAAVHRLPPQEQREVLRRLTESLIPTRSSLDAASNSFWSARSVEELVREQRVTPVTDIHALALPEWPDDESADDLIDYIYSQRRADRRM